MKVDTQGGGFIDDQSFAIGMSIGTDRTDMQKPIAFGFGGGFGQVARPIDGDFDELLPRPPIADAGGGMVHILHTLAGPFEGRAIGKITFNEFYILSFKPAHITAAADNNANRTV